MAIGVQTRPGLSPLEQFVRDYAEVAGGAWEEVEPQVGDLLLPPGVDAPWAGEVLRLAFDPEALPEHPGSQLASFGTPAIDGLLKASAARGATCSAHLVGLNLAPYDLSSHVRRAVRFPEGVLWELRRVRAMDHVQAVFWFEASFLSDQKEQEILAVAMDLANGRETRHLEQLLDFSRLSETAPQPLPETRRLSLGAVYPIARQQVLRSLGGLANQRRRELDERLVRQVCRMQTYYRDLRSESQQQARRAHGDDPQRALLREQALEREEQLRIAELRQKSALRVQLRLVNLLLVHQPKLRLSVAVQLSTRPPATVDLELVWDPLLESLEAPACPACGGSTYALQQFGRGVACPECVRHKPAPWNHRR